MSQVWRIPWLFCPRPGEDMFAEAIFGYNTVAITRLPPPPTAQQEKVMAWFDLAHFAQQKIEQINALDYEIKPTSGSTYADQLRNVIAQYNAKHANDPGFVTVTPESNFLACNTASYDGAGITPEDINVSCTKYFDVGYYFTALANYYNDHLSELPIYASGAMTPLDCVQYVFNTMRMSGWQHYLQYGMEMDLDPSALFDTSAYISAKMQATGMDRNHVINAMKSAGVNPIQDWDANPTIITAQQLMVTNPLTPGMSEGEQWGAIPEPVDPYAQIQATQTLTTTAGETFTGMPGINTLFAANITGGFAGTTLNDTDVITGGANAYNTLQVNIAQNWAGFAGTGADGAGANMTNVGRVLLNNATGNIYSFSLKHTSGVERVDIINSGAGTTQITDAASTLREVRLEGASNAAGTTGTTAQAGTFIQYASGAVGGTQDALTLDVKNVGAAKTATAAASAAKVGSSGVEQLTVNARGDNVLDVTNFNGLTSLAITGNGNLDIIANQQSITSYDASGASGKVNMQVGNISGNSVIKGGLGQDTVTLTQGITGSPLQAQWTGVGSLAVQAGVGASLDFAKSDGALNSVWVAGSGVTLANVRTPSFTIEQVSQNATVNVTGQIDNLYWSDQSLTAVAGAYNSNVAKNAYISVGNKQDVDGAVFNFNSARGQVNLAVAASSTATANDAGSFTGTINAAEAARFTATIGKLEGGSTFNVVSNNAAADKSVTITAADVALGANPGDGSVTTTLNANGAATFNLNLTANNAAPQHAAIMQGSIANAQDVNINVANGNTGSDPRWTLDLTQLAMSNARDVDIAGDGKESVHLGDLGSANMDGAIDLDVTNLKRFVAGDLTTGKGWDIDASITTKGNVTIGDITAGQNAAGSRGNVTLDINMDYSDKTVNSAASEWNIVGNNIKMYMDGVNGTITPQTVLAAQGTIDYDGCAKEDRVIVKTLGNGASTFDMGTGEDTLYIGTTGSSYNLGAGGKAMVNVNFGAYLPDNDQDELYVVNADKGTLAVKVDLLDSGDKIYVQSANAPADVQAATAIIRNSGLQISGTLEAVNQNGCYKDAANVYYVSSNTDATTVIQVVGQTSVDVFLGYSDTTSAN